MKKILSIFMLTVFVTMIVSGCELTTEDETLPEETIEDLEKAVNNMDTQGMMDCLSSDAQDSVESALSLTLDVISAITDIDLDVEASDLINAMPIIQAMVPKDAYGNYAQVDFQVTTTYIKGDKATVYYTEANSGSSAYLNMTKEDDKWLISMSTTPLTADEAERVIANGEEKTAEDEDSDSDDEVEELINDFLEGLGL